MINKPMLVLSFGMVAAMETQTALRVKRNVERLVYFFLEVGIVSTLITSKLNLLIDWVCYQVSSMACKTKPTNLKNVNIMKSYAH